MRLKIVGYYGKNTFECITEAHDDFVSVSMFNLCDAAGIKSHCDQDVRSLIGKEFEVNRFFPAEYIAGSVKLIDKERWHDMGEGRECEHCCERFCQYPSHRAELETEAVPLEHGAACPYMNCKLCMNREVNQ